MMLTELTAHFGQVPTTSMVKTEAEYGYVAAAKYPKCVKTLSFCEMLLPSLGFEEHLRFVPLSMSRAELANTDKQTRDVEATVRFRGRASSWCGIHLVAF